MRLSNLVPFLACGALVAQSAAPTAPTVKFRGSIWGGIAASDRDTTDGSLAYQPAAQGNGEFALEGATLGADVTLPQGWSLKFTAIGGNVGKSLNILTGETGNLALCEALLAWTGGNETVKFGRMWTPLGMEVVDQAGNITASRGILSSYADPTTQMGLDWHHAFTTSFSADLYILNGEDKWKDNNRSKTVGLQANYNHGGASDKVVSLYFFRGPEQDGLGNAANTGAEGRIRERTSLTGQWVWGASTLQWEADYLRNPEDVQNNTSLSKGAGLIFKQQFTDAWALFARTEVLEKTFLDEKARLESYVLGTERKWGSVFARLEMRRDQANSESAFKSADLKTTDGQPFKSATSGTLSLGASF